MAKFNKQDEVAWNWGRDSALGIIIEIFTQPIEKTVQGATIVREASEDNPAYLIKLDSGNEIIKNEDELYC